MRPLPEDPSFRRALRENFVVTEFLLRSRHVASPPTTHKATAIPAATLEAMMIAFFLVPVPTHCTEQS